MNAVLKENGLKPIEDQVSVQDKPGDSSIEAADNQGTLTKIDNDDEVLKKIEMEIDKLKDQMGKGSSEEQMPNKEDDKDEKLIKDKRGRSKSRSKSKSKSQRKESPRRSGRGSKSRSESSEKGEKKSKGVDGK